MTREDDIAAIQRVLGSMQNERAQLDRTIKGLTAALLILKGETRVEPSTPPRVVVADLPRPTEERSTVFWTKEQDEKILSMEGATYAEMGRAVGRHHLSVKARLAVLQAGRPKPAAVDSGASTTADRDPPVVLPAPTVKLKTPEPAPIKDSTRALASRLVTTGSPRKRNGVGAFTDQEALALCWGPRLRRLGDDYSLDGVSISKPRLSRLTNEEFMKKGEPTHRFGPDWSIG